MKNQNIDELAKQMRRDYRKQWNQKNRDKIKIYNKRYWEKKATAFAASVKSEGNNDNRED